VTKQFKSFFILLVGLGLLYWFVSRLDWATVGEHLRNVKLWPLILAGVLINLTIFARSLRWRTFLAPIAQVRFNNLVVATAIGFGGLFVIGRAAEIIRPTILSLREKLQPSATFATILIERIFDTVAVTTLFSISLILFEASPSQATALQRIGSTRTLGFILLAGVLCGLVALLILRLKAKTIILWLERQSVRLPKKLIRPILNFINHLSDGLSILLNFNELTVALIYTVCVWGLISSATWLTLYAFGLRMAAHHIFFILGFGLVGSVVPTPGGSAGAFHTAAAKSLEFLGIDPNLAASVAIVYHLIAFGPPFLIGLYYLVTYDISLKQLREIIASEENPHGLAEEKAGIQS